MTTSARTALTTLGPNGLTRTPRGRRGGTLPGHTTRAYENRITGVGANGLPRRRRSSGGASLGASKTLFVTRVGPNGLPRRYGGIRSRLGGGPVLLQQQTNGLMLQRTDRDTGLALAVADGYRDDADGFRSFNGAGSAEISEGDWSLSNVGESITVACRWRIGGADATGATGPVSKIQQVIGLPGFYQANPTLEAGISLVIPDPTSSPVRVALRQYNNGSPLTEELAGVEVSADFATLFILVLARTSSGVRATLWMNGVRAGQFDAIIDPGSFEISKLVVGDAVESDGTFSQAAIWNRELTEAEINSLANNLNCNNYTEPTGGGESFHPLIAEDGTSLISPDVVNNLTRRVPVVGSGGPRIERRRLNEHVPRQYELRFNAATPGEVARVMRAYDLTRGAGWTRWRHNEDDPPSSAGNAPRWRILGDISIERDTAGSSAAMSLVLEEVVN